MNQAGYGFNFFLFFLATYGGLPISVSVPISPWLQRFILSRKAISLHFPTFYAEPVLTLCDSVVVLGFMPPELMQWQPLRSPPLGHPWAMARGCVGHPAMLGWAHPFPLQAVLSLACCLSCERRGAMATQGQCQPT